MRHRFVVGVVLAVAIGLSTLLVSAGAALGGPAAMPKSDVVGAGLVNCAAVTGEVGYGPVEIIGGTSSQPVTIWFVGKMCTAGSSTTTPVPRTVIGSMSFVSSPASCSSLIGTGTGTLNLAYNYPPVPTAMIDPSTASVSVTGNDTALDLTGAVGQSYVDQYPTTFSAALKLVPIAGQSCQSEYIAEGSLTDI